MMPLHELAPLGMTAESVSNLYAFAAAHDWGRDGMAFVLAPAGLYGLSIRVHHTESNDPRLGGHTTPDASYRDDEGRAWATFYGREALREWAGY